jgi:uncharacterized OB-fold protein
MDERFQKFGTVSFTKITKTNDFIQYLEDGKLMGTKCKKCGATWFPPRADCAKCFESEMEWFEVSGAGKLLSYSELQYGPVGFEGDLPYTIALLDFGEHKVFGRIAKDVPYDDLEVGMELKAVANTLDNGQLNYVFTKA